MAPAAAARLGGAGQARGRQGAEQRSASKRGCVCAGAGHASACPGPGGCACGACMVEPLAGAEPRAGAAGAATGGRGALAGQWPRHGDKGCRHAPGLQLMLTLGRDRTERPGVHQAVSEPTVTVADVTAFWQTPMSKIVCGGVSGRGCCQLNKRGLTPLRTGHPVHSVLCLTSPCISQTKRTSPPQHKPLPIQSLHNSRSSRN
ncbi:hypothetical protein HaLaN_23103 [Haematococcus lacustris]|uniref:Uncharacterized protein n=1 Tax=Haematococcus lacustris TaxID=44745 RepID=A0A6A0A1Q3_HAELA|nr:hypothetical protein HaLaN_23103 [Haematococcus lacustris]